MALLLGFCALPWNAAIAAATCSGWVRELSIQSDGSVFVYANARTGSLRICNLNRPQLNPWGNGPPNPYARSVSPDTCARWTESLQSAVARGTAVTVDLIFGDATQTTCSALPLSTAPAPHPLPTAVKLNN